MKLPRTILCFITCATLGAAGGLLLRRQVSTGGEPDAAPRQVAAEEARPAAPRGKLITARGIPTPAAAAPASEWSVWAQRTATATDYRTKWLAALELLSAQELCTLTMTLAPALEKVTGDELGEGGMLPLTFKEPASELALLAASRWMECDAAGAASWLGTLLGPTHRRTFSLLAKELARINPDEALRLVKSHGGELAVAAAVAKGLESASPARAASVYDALGAGFWMNRNLQDLAKGWALTDPEAALRWSGLPAHQRTQFQTAVLGELGKSDPMRAMRLLAAIDPVQQMGGLLEIVANLARKSSPAESIPLISALGSPEQTGGLMHCYFEALARVDSQVALTEARGLDLDRKLHGMALFGCMAALSTAARARVALEEPDPEFRAEFCSLAAWSMYMEDPAAAEAWAANLTEPGLRQKVQEGLLITRCREDPEPVIQQISEMADPAERARLLGVVLDQIVYNHPKVALAHAAVLGPETCAVVLNRIGMSSSALQKAGVANVEAAILQLAAEAPEYFARSSVPARADPWVRSTDLKQICQDVIRVRLANSIQSAREWAEAMPPGDIRAIMVNDVYFEWRMRDSEAADAWMRKEKAGQP